jgi:hypothetical protein
MSSYTIYPNGNGGYTVYQDSGCKCSDQDFKNSIKCCLGLSIVCRLLAVAGLIMVLADNAAWNGGEVYKGGIDQDVTLKLTQYKTGDYWISYSDCNTTYYPCSEFKDLGIQIFGLVIAVIVFQFISLVLCCCKVYGGIIFLSDLVTLGITIAALVIIDYQFTPEKFLGGSYESMQERESGQHVGRDFLLVITIFEFGLATLSKFWCTFEF